MNEAITGNGLKRLAALFGVTGLLTGCIASGDPAETARMGAASRQDFVQLCTADAIRTIASSIQASTVEPGKIANQPGPFLTDGVQYTPAKDGIPAFCQVTGSYVTNPETGKTSNFLATFP